MPPPVTNPFIINNGAFAGNYQTAGGASYYLNGDTSADTIHFSVNDPNSVSVFHLTYSLAGSNVGIWYRGGGFNNVNAKNIPAYKLRDWNTWWTANKANCDAAAADFYGQFS
jgi:hypothetical protein